MFKNILHQNIAISISLLYRPRYYSFIFYFSKIKLSFFTKAMSFDRYTYTVIPNDQETQRTKNAGGESTNITPK